MAKDIFIKFFKVVKVFLFLMFLAGVALIGLYPIKNQGITVTVATVRKSVSTYVPSSDIDTLKQFSVSFPGVRNEEITEVRLSRFFKTICVDKINSGALSQYATVSDDSIVFNENACNLVKENSRSAVMERLFLSEILLGILLFIYIFVNALAEKFDSSLKGNHGPIFEIKKFCSHFSNYIQYMIYAANADLKAEVANSYLNRLWWLLEPFFNMLVYVIVFGRVMGNSIQNYATFVYSALLMWGFFSRVINYSVKCVRNNRDIVTKIYVPKHVLLITNMFVAFFKLLFSLIVLVPMLFIFKVHIGLAVFWVIPPYMLMILLSFGIGMIFLHYGVYIDDLAYAVGILLSMLMFLSGPFYDVIAGLPKPLNVLMLCLNPVSMFIDTMRNALLYNTVVNVPLIVLWTVLSLFICYIGIHIVYKNENSYVKVV